MKREDFMFTVGYQGSTAIIDSRARKRYGKLSVHDLVDEGLYKAAFCAVIFDNDSEGMQYLIDSYNAGHGSRYETKQHLARLFGVDEVPDNVTRVKSL